MTEKNMTMLCDFYELTMANGYFKNGFYKKITYFDVFYRSVPDNGGFAIVAGLEQVIDYIKNLHFSSEDIDYLRSKNIFDEEFLDYLRIFILQVTYMQYLRAHLYFQMNQSLQ